jgi:methylase of polypeptide subunit release factors
VSRWHVEPFRADVTAEQLAAVRELFVRHGFTEDALRAVGEIDSIHRLVPLHRRTQGFTRIVDMQSLFVQLFIDGAQLPPEATAKFLDAETRAILDAAGLLAESVTNPGYTIATIAIYPVERLYVASDRLWDIDAVADGAPTDVVYSSITPEAEGFVRLMPRNACDEYLELCSGTGIAALVAGRDFARHSTAVDITERSTRFATFNAALNGLANMTAVQGDLYEPVRGRTFDLITAHPPYVPSEEAIMTFRDGGEDGEHITRAILNGLHEYLRPGGIFYCDCLMTDRTDAPLELRIRAMLGERHEEFDVLVGERRTVAPWQLFSQPVLAGRKDQPAYAKQVQSFEQLGIERFVSTAFVIQRRATPRAVVTRRRNISVRTTADDFQWYLEWSIAEEAWSGSAERYLSSRPRAVPSIEFRSRAIYQDGEWQTIHTSLATLAPFAAEAECAPWFGALLARCDGMVTAREHLEHFRRAGVVSADAKEDDFAGLIRQMADAGFIELDFFPLPSRLAASSMQAGS